MTQVKIIKAKFTRTEVKIVQKEIRKSPDITGYSLRELLVFKNIFKAYLGGEFTGGCIGFDFPPRLPSGLRPAETDGETGGGNWTEPSGFLVLPKFRGQGIGKLLYKFAYDEAVNRRRNIYIVSRNPAMQKIMRGSNLTIITKFRQLPQVIRLHSLGFAISWYRLFEAIRKSVMKKSGGFIFGIRLTT